MRTEAKLQKAICLKIIIANDKSHFQDFFREILLQKLPTHRPTKSPTRPDFQNRGFRKVRPDPTFNIGGRCRP